MTIASNPVPLTAPSGPLFCACGCGERLTGKQAKWKSNEHKNRANKNARQRGFKFIRKPLTTDQYLFGRELSPGERLRELARAFWNPPLTRRNG